MIEERRWLFKMLQLGARRRGAVFMYCDAGRWMLSRVDAGWLS